MNENTTKTNPIIRLFKNIAWLNLDNQEKSNIVQKINDHISGDALYWSLVCFSVVIATFGLLQNSVAVVIGAMLIAPLLQPIQGVAFSIATGNDKLFWKSSILLIKSVIVAILIAFLCTFFTPIHLDTPEMLARTTPNLLDLFIALGSSVVAFLALRYEQLSESIGGVAMAVSLMPPLAVTGIEIGFGNVSLAWGSFFLFLTNLFAIVITGGIIFLFYGFFPHHQDSQKYTLRQFMYLGLVGILITIPLSISIQSIAQSVQLHAEAVSVTRETLDNVLPGASLDKIDLLDFSNQDVTLLGIVKLEEGTNFYEDARESLRKALQDKLQRHVNLDLEIVRVASIISHNGDTSEVEQSLKDDIRNAVKSVVPQATIIQIDIGEKSIQDVSAQAPVKKALFTARIVLAVSVDTVFSDPQKKQIETFVVSHFPNITPVFDWVLLQQNTIAIGKNQTAQEQYHQKLRLAWSNILTSHLPTGATFDNVEITWTTDRTKSGSNNSASIHDINIRFDLYLPIKYQRQLPQIRKELLKLAKDNMGSVTDMSFRVFSFQEETISP